MSLFSAEDPAQPKFEPRDRSPLPSDESQQPASLVGLQLIVSGLERHDHQAAVAHMHRIIEEYNQAHPADRLPPLSVTPLDSRSPVDYVFLSIPPHASNQPRPDWLENIRNILCGIEGIHADWKVNNGPDRTRRIYFHGGDDVDANALKPQLDRYLANHQVATQGAYINRALNRVVYDLVSQDAVTWLRSNPPTFERRTYHPEQYRFIQPIYGLEVAITGLRGIDGAHQILDQYFNRKYGNVVAHSRMELNDDVYCVIYSSWTVTCRVLSDPLEAFTGAGSAFSRLFATSDPYLLYLVNTVGVPTNLTCLSPSSTRAVASSEIKILRAELEDVRQQGISAMNSFHAILQDIHSALHDLRWQYPLSTQAISASSASFGISNRLTRLNIRLMSAQQDQQDRDMAELTRTFPGNFVDQQRRAFLVPCTGNDRHVAAEHQRSIHRTIEHSAQLDGVLHISISLRPAMLYRLQCVFNLLILIGAVLLWLHIMRGG